MASRLSRTVAAAAVVSVVFAVSACGANSTAEPSPSALTPAASTTDSPTAGPTATASTSPTNATGSPTNAADSLVLQVSATTAKPGERVNLSVSGPQSLAGKQVAIVDMIAPDKYKIFSTLTLNANGQATGYVVLGVTDALQAFVPTNPVTGHQWNPGQPILGESGLVTITVN